MTTSNMLRLGLGVLTTLGTLWAIQACTVTTTDNPGDAGATTSDSGNPKNDAGNGNPDTGMGGGMPTRVGSVNISQLIFSGGSSATVTANFYANPLTAGAGGTGAQTVGPCQVVTTDLTADAGVVTPETPAKVNTGPITVMGGMLNAMLMLNGTDYAPFDKGDYAQGSPAFEKGDMIKVTSTGGTVKGLDLTGTGPDAVEVATPACDDSAMAGTFVCAGTVAKASDFELKMGQPAFAGQVIIGVSSADTTTAKKIVSAVCTYDAMTSTDGTNIAVKLPSALLGMLPNSDSTFTITAQTTATQDVGDWRVTLTMQNGYGVKVGTTALEKSYHITVM